MTSIKEPIVTSDYILQGALYALEQCGILLHDAVAIFKRDSYATAVVLAEFAREELGRSIILFNFWKKADSGDTVTVAALLDACEDHVKKQEHAQLSTIQTALPGSRLYDLLRTRRTSHLHSPEWKNADEELSASTRAQRRRTPKDRHKSRVEALYVEPNDSRTGWNRPSIMAQEPAQRALREVMNDYTGAYDRYEYGSIRDVLPDGPKLYMAIQTWSGRPKLPPPIWGNL